MAGNQYDVIIGGTGAKLARGIEGVPYRRRFVRREIQQNLLSQSENAVALRSRADSPSLFQSDWSAGAQWWKPLLRSNDLNSYYRANNMDLWTEPGKVVPLALRDEITIPNGELDDMAFPWGQDDQGDIYLVGDTNNVNASYKDVYLWTPGSDDIVQETGYHSGMPNTHTGMRTIVYDSSDEYFYVISPQAMLTRFSPENTTQSTSWLNLTTTYNGTTLLIVPGQGLMVYNGEELKSIDKSGPTATTVFDDGLGPEALYRMTSSGTSSIAQATSLNLAVSSSEGVYYVKNTVQGGSPLAYVFRIDKDASGAWIGKPIATLPRGEIALDITYHLGNILISTARGNISTLLAASNTERWMGITIYSISNQSINVLGTPLGYGSEVDEMPFKFLQTFGSRLYIGGHKRLWVYDAGRGGLHAVLEWPTQSTFHTYMNMFATKDSLNQPGFIFTGFVGSATDEHYVVFLEDDGAADIVTSFGDDLTHYTLESNYFDGNLPMEDKQITKIEVLHDPLVADEWTVQISADDGAWTTVLQSNTASSTYGSAAPSSALTGRRFRYKLIYQTKNGNKKALRALLITMATGEMIEEWELTLDGGSLINVNNQVQNPDDFYDNMATIGNLNGLTTLIDNYQDADQGESDASTGRSVRVQGVEINKEEPGASLVNIVLREA